MSSVYLTAAVLMDLPKCVFDVWAIKVTSLKRSGCVPPMVLPSGLSQSTRSLMEQTFWGTSCSSLWLIRSCISLVLQDL